MSEFNEYAKQVDEIARASFKEYETAADALKKAEDQVSSLRREYHSVNSPQYAAKSTRAQADYLEAMEGLKKAKKSLGEREKEISALRQNLSDAVAKRFVADPASLDSNTMELLKSGILKSNEYESLMKNALQTGNHTMARMIGKYAEKEAQAEDKRHGGNTPTARHLRQIAYMASVCNGGYIMQNFDTIADVYHRATRNPGSMIKMWDELTSEIVANF